MKLFDDDFSWLEQRCLAQIGVKPQRDLHREKAAQMFGVAYEDVTPEQRKVAKLENYREVYK